MKKSELISVLAKHADVSKTEAERVLAALEQAVKVELLEGGEVTLPGIGTLATAQRAARQGRNPKTGETIAITGKNSCAVMDIGELERVADEMRRFGFKPSTSTSTAREKHGRPHLRRTTAAAMMDKVEALLADGGYHWNYAHAMARRMFGCEKVEYLDNDQLHKLVAALQIAANRRKGK